MGKAELCGLRWADVAKPRTITLAAETVALLREQKKRQAILKMRNRTTYRDFGLVFCKEWPDVTTRRDMVGLPIQANHFGARLFAPLVKAAGVRKITPHGMRHTCATLLLLGGEPVHVVDDRLGHSDVSRRRRPTRTRAAGRAAGVGRETLKGALWPQLNGNCTPPIEH